MIAALFVVLAAAGHALASVLQHRAARVVPPWIVLEALGMGCILLGSIGLARSPVPREHTVVTAARTTPASRRARR